MLVQSLEQSISIFEKCLWSRGIFLMITILKSKSFDFAVDSKAVLEKNEFTCKTKLG